MEKKVVFAFVLVILLVATFIPFTKAEVQQVTSGDAAFSLSSWLKHNMGLTFFDTYSIVGDRRSCDDNPEHDWNNLQAGSYTVVQIDAYCDDGGLIDTYSNGWNPYKEFGNSIGFTCTSANAPCNIEIYCCPYGWCSDDDDCEDWVGGGSECEHSSQRDPDITLDFGTWSYCTEEESIDCWYIDNYECIQRTYNGQSECPAYYQDPSKVLYDDEDDCEDNICSSGQTRCKSSSVRQYCNYGRWTDANCQSGYTCSNGQCVQQQCNPNCAGKACGASDGCGGTCQTGSCPSGQTCRNGACCTPQCPAANTVSCGMTINPTNGCGTCSGTGTKCSAGYNCTNGQCIQSQQPQSQFQITSGPTFAKTTGKPGESISVTATIKNTGNAQGSYYIESGIAKKGWGGYSMVSAPWYENLFSFTYFKCCSANEFYDGAVVVLNAGESQSITLHPKVPTSSSRDGCNNQGTAWAGYTNNYWIGFNACNNCYGEPDHSCIKNFGDNWQTFTVEEEVQLYCGDGTCNNGETKTDCCLDCGCPTGKQCDEVNFECITPPPVEECGDDTVNAEEQCDGTDLNGDSCKSLGYDSGTLSCSNFCLFNTENCIDNTPENPPDEETGEGFCLEFANGIVKPITKSDNCTTNSIVFIISAFVIFMILISVIKK